MGVYLFNITWFGYFATSYFPDWMTNSLILDISAVALTAVFLLRVIHQRTHYFELFFTLGKRWLKSKEVTSGPGFQKRSDFPLIISINRKTIGFVKSMPVEKHVKGLGRKEQRQYEHIKESAEKSGRYGNRSEEVAARTVLKQHKEKGHKKGD